MNTRPGNEAEPSFREFVALMAMMMSLAALSIDAILPALSEIGQALGVQRENDNQLVIAFLFLGLAAGQMFYGPLSDSTGRKPAVYAGLALFIVGCLLSLLATNFAVMLTGRFLQGAGVAGPRAVTLALVRDKYEGRAMAQVMSFVMAVFILVPVVAPALGQAVLIVSNWRFIFGAFLGLALIIWIWFGLRQPETLDASRRIPFSFVRMALAVREVLSNRIALGYTIAVGFILGSLVAYLSSAPQIFQQQYGLGMQFPLYFAVLALALGGASLINTRLVMLHGMRRMCVWALAATGGLSIAFFAIAYALDGHPPLWALMAYLMMVFFAMGILFGNLNALAMEPLGHIAGAGSAVVGTLSTLISFLLGTAVSQAYDGTILPLVGGFAVLGILAMTVVQWVEYGKPQGTASESRTLKQES